jgi:hypothetical protein
MFYSSRKGYDETPRYTQEDSEARDDRNDTR